MLFLVPLFNEPIMNEGSFYGLEEKGSYMTSQKVMLEVKHLTKIFGANPKRALPLLEQGTSKEEILQQTGLTVGVHEASFTVYEGEIFVIMGLSGSGKSTLVRMLNRLIEPNAGSVSMHGKDIISMTHDELVQFRLHNMSMVFQSFALMPHLTVLENAAFGLELAGIPKDERSKRALQALDQVGLAGWENCRPDQLSGGMQQRVGLARGLAVDPEIMLMDEAFSALDPLIRTEMQDELLMLQEKYRRTIIFISHDLNEALRIGDRIGIMEGGKLIQVGTPEEVLQNPANDYVKAFFKGVDPTSILSAKDIASQNHPTIIISKGGSLRTSHEILSSSERDYAFVLDPQHKLQGVVSTDSILEKLNENDPNNTLRDAFIPHIQAVKEDDTMQDILPVVAQEACPVPVVDCNNKFKGVVSKARFLNTLHRSGEAPEFSEASNL